MSIFPEICASAPYQMGEMRLTRAWQQTQARLRRGQVCGAGSGQCHKAPLQQGMDVVRTTPHKSLIRTNPLQEEEKHLP